MIKAFYFPLILMLILLAVGDTTFLDKVETIKKSTQSTIEMRAGLFDQYLRLMSANNTALSKSIQHVYSDTKMDSV